MDDYIESQHFIFDILSSTTNIPSLTQQVYEIQQSSLSILRVKSRYLYLIFSYLRQLLLCLRDKYRRSNYKIYQFYGF